MRPGTCCRLPGAAAAGAEWARGRHRHGRVVSARGRPRPRSRCAPELLPAAEALLLKGRSGGASTKHLYRSGVSSTDDHILWLASGVTPNLRHQTQHGHCDHHLQSVAVTNVPRGHTLVATWRPRRLELYLDGISRANSTAANTNTSDAFGIYRWGWGFSTNQDFNGDIALILCCGACWTGHMVRRWHADPFGFLRPLERGACAHRECATRHAPVDRHRRGHLPHGIASNGLVSASCRVIGPRRAPRPGSGGRARDPDHDPGLPGPGKACARLSAKPRWLRAGACHSAAGRGRLRAELRLRAPGAD